MSFENEIKEKLGDHNPEEVIKDRIFTSDKLTEDHKKTLEKYTSLIHLTLNAIGLESLENFPNLKKTQIVSILYIYQIYLD